MLAIALSALLFVSDPCEPTKPVQVPPVVVVCYGEVRSRKRWPDRARSVA